MPVSRGYAEAKYPALHSPKPPVSLAFCIAFVQTTLALFRPAESPSVTAAVVAQGEGGGRYQRLAACVSLAPAPPIGPPCPSHVR